MVYPMEKETKEEYIKKTKEPLTERDVEDVTFDKKLVIKQIKNEEDKNKFLRYLEKAQGNINISLFQNKEAKMKKSIAFLCFFFIGLNRLVRQP
jgi:hypothetical protein